jgi:hypothetical protein
MGSYSHCNGVYDDAHITCCRVFLTVVVERMSLLVKQSTLDGDALNRPDLQGGQDLVSEVHAACTEFALLMQLVSFHDSNQSVLVSAVKWGSKFVEQLLKVGTLAPD